MPVTQPTIIDRLDREWDDLVRRGIADDALATWRRHSPALDVDTIDDLADALADRRPDAASRNRVLHALMELAPRDQVAARLVLRRFLPCVTTLVPDHDPFDADEWVGLLVATAYEVICDYPVGDGPDDVTAKLSREIRHRALGALSDRRRGDRELLTDAGDLDAARDVDDDEPFGTADLHESLCWAERRLAVAIAAVA